MTIEKLLSVQFVDWMNDNKFNIDLPCYITLGAPNTLTGEALWMQILGQARPIKKYLRGRFQGVYPFAVYYRMQETALNGMEANMLIPHENINEYLSENLPELADYKVVSIEMTKGAAPFQHTADGTIIYQSLWQMIFEN